jgi:hypothetical protein
MNASRPAPNPPERVTNCARIDGRCQEISMSRAPHVSVARGSWLIPLPVITGMLSILNVAMRGPSVAENVRFLFVSIPMVVQETAAVLIGGAFIGLFAELLRD